MAKIPWKRWALPLGGLIVIKLLFTYLLLQSGFILLCSDDWARIGWAWRWQNNMTLFPHAYFLPLHSYLYGAGLDLYFDLNLTPRIISYALSLLLLPALYKLAWHLYRERPTAWLACGLAVALPLHSWMSLSPLSEMLSVLLLVSAAGAFLAWQGRPTLGRILWLGGSLFLANACRYEAWMFTPLVLAGVVFTIWRQAIPRQQALPQLILIGFLATAVPLVWISRHAALTGDPLYFLHYYTWDSRQYFASRDFSWAPLQAMWAQSPVLLAGLAVTLLAWARERTAPPVPVALALYATLLILFPLLVEPPTIMPERILFLPLVLLTPLAAHGLLSFGRSFPFLRKFGLGWIWAAAAALLSLGPLTRYPSDGLSPDGLLVGRLIARLDHLQALSKTDTVVLEQTDPSWMEVVIAAGKTPGLTAVAEVDGTLRQLDWLPADPDRAALLLCRTERFCRRFIDEKSWREAPRFDSYTLVPLTPAVKKALAGR